MVLHKVVWEVLKRRDGSPRSKPQEATGGLKKLVKLAKTGFLLFLLVQTLFLGILPISADPAALRIIGVLIYIFGLATAITGRIQLGDNWIDLEDAQVLPEQKIIRSGVYRFVRHPIYLGDILLVLGLELALNSWLVLLTPLIALVVFKQAREEEQILSDAFPDYRNYQRETKMFIPGLL